MRTPNTTALRVKYLGASNTQGSRLSIAQLNNRKRCIISYDYRFDTMGQIEDTLKHCPSVKDWYIIIDNTQNDSYLVGLTFHNNSFADLIMEIKAIN